MDNSEWYIVCLKEKTRELHKLEKSLELYIYDVCSSERVRKKISYLLKEMDALERQIPARKIHEYGGPYKCLRCGCVVDKYAKYCHYCGQRFLLHDAVEKESVIEGWCADK